MERNRYIFTLKGLIKLGNFEINLGKKVIETEIKALGILKNLLSNEFSKAIDILFKTKGKIIVSGLGKSGHIASKISSTFSSIGSPSLFLHPTEANHGDLGMINKGDSSILISNSGETSELKNIILHCEKLKIPIISITSQKSSTLAKKSNIIILIPNNIEACPLELAPTSSTTCTLALGDAMAVTLLKKRGFTSDDFHALHPGGKLGQMLLQVGEIMKTGSSIPLIKKNSMMTDAILEMTSKGQGCVGIISKNRNLIGMITDGDLRRHMASVLLEKKVEDVMTPNPLFLNTTTLVSDALDIMNEKSITNIFVIDKKRPVGIIHMQDLLRLKSL